MNDLDAMKNAAALGNAFSARDDVIRAYALAFKGYDAGLMADAVEYAVENCERLPTVKGVIAMYRKAEQLARVETAAAGVPCAYCKAAGGWTIAGSDRLIPEIRTAVPPYLPGIMVRDDAGSAMGPAWGRLPACASHGLSVARREGHGGWEPSRVKEHRGDLVEWRDRWEAEHAVNAASAIEAEMARHPSAAVTAFVTSAVNAPPPASVAVSASFEPAVVLGSIEPETSLSVAPLRSDVPPPLTPDEEAAFDRGIKF